MPKIRFEIDKVKFIEVIKICSSKSDICRKLHIHPNGVNFRYINDLIKELKCDISHFIRNKQNRKYERKEKECPCCGCKFISIEGSKKGEKTFCSRKCSGKTRSGTNHYRYREKGVCLCCNKKLSSHQKKFCSKKCCGRFLKLETFKKIENGTFKGYKKGNSKNQHLKSYLIEKNGHICMVCKLSEWMGEKIPLQLDHIDGDSDNDKIENIRNICPNCHAQTPTYCNKNKGKGKRKHRLEDYHNGKDKW